MSYADRLAAYRAAVERVDVTRAFSDDHRVAVAGEQAPSWRDLFKTISRADAVAIWNAHVDRRVLPHSRYMFHIEE